MRKAEGAAARRRYEPPEVLVPVQDVIGTCDDARSQWAIAVINRHAEKEIEATISLGDHSLVGKIDSIILAGSNVDSYNDVEQPDRVAPVSVTHVFKDGRTAFPQHSVAILKVGEA